jgi:hypothetical protein
MDIYGLRFGTLQDDPWGHRVQMISFLTNFVVFVRISMLCLCYLRQSMGIVVDGLKTNWYVLGFGDMMVFQKLLLVCLVVILWVFILIVGPILLHF